MRCHPPARPTPTCTSSWTRAWATCWRSSSCRPARPWGATRTPAWTQHLALEVDSVETHGGQRRASRPGRRGGRPHRPRAVPTIYFFDPNGHRLELAANTLRPGMLEALDEVKWDMLEEWAQTKEGAQARRLDARRTLQEMFQKTCNPQDRRATARWWWSARDLTRRAVPVIARTLQAALDNWANSRCNCARCMRRSTAVRSKPSPSIPRPAIRRCRGPTSGQTVRPISTM